MQNSTRRKPRAHSSSEAMPDDPCSKSQYRLVVMGAAAVGKTNIITRFLSAQFVSEYKATVEELYRGEYEIDGRPLTLDILDTSGAYSFPAMRRLSISTGDAFVLVYSVEDEDSFEEVKNLRQQIIDEKGDDDVPIVIVGNKADIDETKRAVKKEIAEMTVSIDWGHAYVEASAKEDTNIIGIFKELLREANVHAPLSPAFRRRRSGDGCSIRPTRKRSTKRCVMS